MSRVKTTTLPNILQKYDPEYQQKTDVNTAGCGELKSSKVRVEEEVTGHHGNYLGTPRNKKVKDKDSTRTAPPSLSRETTGEIKKRQDRERNKHTFDCWQMVKKVIHEIENERLREKITLQCELHRIRDQQHQHLQKQRRHLDIKKREKEKAEKNAKFKALQQVCQESLDEDHRVAKEKRLAKKKEKQGKEHEKSAHLGKVSATVADEVQKQTINNEEPGQIEEPVALVTSPPLGQPRASLSGLHEEVFETLEEEEECEDEKEMARLDQETLPWHHVQLYELYGKEADYFLHPKIETEAKADVVLNPRLKAVGGRADAGALWDALRYESRMKLINMDSKLLSSDLRSAFGAFAREGLTKNKKPVVRNFYSSDDVPDMSRLMDQTRIHNAQDFRHKVELMFRSSNINRDRTKVLLYNNPPPDLNNQEGTEGIDRYMPSWADTWDEESELSYKKWLSPSRTESQVEYGIQTSDRATPDNEKPTSLPPSSQHHQKAKKSEQAKYVFLTEEQATTPGQFSRRRKESVEAKGGPTAYSTQLPTIQMQKSHSAMAMLGNDGFDSSRSAGVSQPDKGERKRAQSEMSNHFITQWQPLSLNALLEYKQSHDALGQGEFGHGQKPVWSGVTSLTAV